MYGDLTYKLSSEHGPISVGMSVLGNILVSTTFWIMYMLLDCLCVEHGNAYPKKLWSKRIYHDVMYCNIDAGDHSASSPVHHSVKHLNQMFLLFWPHALGGNFYRSIWESFPMTWLTGHHLQDQLLRVYHPLSFQVATCPKIRTRQIKHEFH